MAEFKFVMKCFLFACAVVALTQLKTGGLTIEARIQDSLLSSSTADFINEVAQGGIKLFGKAMDYSKEKVSRVEASMTVATPEPRKQTIRYPAAKKTVDNSDLRTEYRKNSEISHDADFNYDSDLE